MDRKSLRNRFQAAPGTTVKAKKRKAQKAAKPKAKPVEKEPVAPPPPPPPAIQEEGDKT